MKLCHCSHVGTTILIQNCKQSQACRVRADVPVPPGTLPPGLQAVLQIQLVLGELCRTPRAPRGWSWLWSVSD